MGRPHDGGPEDAFITVVHGVSPIQVDKTGIKQHMEVAVTMWVAVVVIDEYTVVITTVSKLYYRQHTASNYRGVINQNSRKSTPIPIFIPMNLTIAQKCA